MTKALRIKRTTKATFRIIDFPKHFNFDDGYDETTKFLERTRNMFFQDRVGSIEINHDTCESISPEAALVLIAEFNRAKAYAKHSRLIGTYPKSDAVRAVLGGVGYLKNFGMKWKRYEPDKRQFLMHFTNRRGKPLVMKELVQHFTEVAKFDPEDVKALGSAIIECMANVTHAYPKKDKVRRLFRQWWLLGYRDPSNNEISFCFFDQGVGIPKTIRTRWKDALPVVSPTDSALIVKGVLEGYSSTQAPSRGRGLPKLKAFIDGAENGELIIVSDRCHCIFKKGVSPSERMHETSIGGTLVVWRLQPKK